MKLKLLAGLRKVALLVLICPPLSNCTVAREQARLTYDSAHILPGATRREIEWELGAPVNTLVGERGEITAYYDSSRVSSRSKRTMRVKMVLTDVFTFGAAEIYNPLGLRNDEEKRFTVQYDSASVARSISVYFLSPKCHRTQRDPLIITSLQMSDDLTCNPPPAVS